MGRPAELPASQDWGRTPETLDDRSSEEPSEVEKKVWLPYMNWVAEIRMTGSGVHNFSLYPVTRWTGS